jgi:hypothetical protein
MEDKDFEQLMALHRDECLRIALEMLGLRSEQEPRDGDYLASEVRDNDKDKAA